MSAVPTQDEQWGDYESTPRARFVRSYTLTAGRTDTKVDLPYEATLRLGDGGFGDRPGGVPGKILDVCDQRSVAEVSAHLKQPIGVVRVLLGDLVQQGWVVVQATMTENSSVDERRDLIERTLRGLRAY